MTDIELRFLSHTERLPNGCLIWTAAKVPGGYGTFKLATGKPGGRGIRAHRWAYEHWVGPIPDGLQVDHLCHNRDEGCLGGECLHRLCVEPTHLEAVTPQTNVLRGKGLTAKFARTTECPQGHPYSPENTYIGPSGARFCRTCNREKQRAIRQRKTAD